MSYLVLKPTSYSFLQFMGLLGVIISAYSLYVENQKHKDPNYEALCDISEHLECSKVLTSENSHFVKATFPQIVAQYPALDQSNALYGLFFYIAIILYDLFPFTLIPFRETLLFFAAAAALGFSIFLARILLEMGDLCLVCTSSYAVNAVIFFLSLKEWYFANSQVIHKTKKD